MLRSKIFLLLIALAVTGCATTEPVIQTVIQRVEVPIPVPCKVDIPVEPKFGFDKLTPDGSLFSKTQILLADRQLHLAYSAELLASLKSCVK